MALREPINSKHCFYKMAWCLSCSVLVFFRLWRCDYRCDGTKLGREWIRKEMVGSMFVCESDKLIARFFDLCTAIRLRTVWLVTLLTTADKENFLLFSCVTDLTLWSCKNCFWSVDSWSETALLVGSFLPFLFRFGDSRTASLCADWDAKSSLEIFVLVHSITSLLDPVLNCWVVALSLHLYPTFWGFLPPQKNGVCSLLAV